MKFQKFNQSLRYIIMSGLVLILVISGFFLYTTNKEEDVLWEIAPSTSDEEIAVEVSESTTTTEILVDIKGAIQQPGVYHLPSDARLHELILAAGGFTKEAEERQLNLAEKLSDQQMIYVPSKDEVDFSVELPQLNQEGNAETGLINLNTATLLQLQELPGIGPAKAQAIITYREENGLFKTVEDLLNISGFGEKTLEKLRAMITL